MLAVAARRWSFSRAKRSASRGRSSNRCATHLSGRRSKPWHTLYYDLSVMTAEPDPRSLLASITTSALVIAGGDGPPWIRHGAGAIAKALPNGSHLLVPGLTQDIKAELLAPPMSRFLST